MIAHIEQPDHSYIKKEIPEPSGCFFCDACTDCLRCYHEDGFCWDGGLPMWVIYLDDPLNPNKEVNCQHTKKMA